ncbi:MAG: Thivi_2564 family membrane protein [Dehalococcoidia bacterium]
MDLLQFIVLICILGLVWWLLSTYVPMPPAGKTALTIAFVVIVILGLLSFLGLGLGMLHYRPHLGG